MSAPLHPGFRFATEAQWGCCIFVGADRRTAEARKGLRPFAPYATPPTRFATAGAHAPAITDTSEILWRDDEGKLQRLPWSEKLPQSVEAAAAIATARRLVATPSALWAAGEAGPLKAFDIAGLARQLVADLPGQRVLDFAGDGHDGIYALTGSGEALCIVHIDYAGNAIACFDAPPGASALVFLLRAERLVVLAASRLHWFDPDTGQQLFSIAIEHLRPCFDPIAIGSDGCSRLFVAGRDGKPAGARSRVLTIESDGNLLGTISLEGTPTGVTADRAHLYVTTAEGLLRFDPAITVPQGAGEVRAELLTPMLTSPAETAQRWTRIEANAVLPAGCAIEISFVSTADRELRDRIAARLADRSVPPGQRLDDWRREVGGLRRISFHGEDSEPGEATMLAAPLHDVRDPWLWVHIALIASPGGQIPVLSELSVLYPGPTLIEHLPAIYRSGEFEPGNFVRGLVGVLEATTQGLDARIGRLGRNIHPQTASDEWLDYVARWLGLPWDDALSTAQKRRIASSGTAIANGYGTRAGLEALLACLMPEMPKRFRIVDTTAEFGLATLGGGRCGGSRLPAILAGLPATATELGNKAILGVARLPCEGAESESSRLVGHIRVDIAADAAEQRAWSPWLRTLIRSVLPATTRAELRWLARAAFGGPGELGDGLSLEGDPVAHLGTDAVTGVARLGGQARTALPQHLSGDSPLQ